MKRYPILTIVLGVVWPIALLVAMVCDLRAEAHDAPLPRSFILWDTEYTSWEGSMQRNWRGKIPGTSQSEHREVIQLSALRVHVQRTPAGDRLIAGDTLRLLVRPAVNSQLSAYVSRLTNITQAELDAKGVPLRAALAQFHRFVARGRAAASGCTPLLGWGLDWLHVEADLRLTNQSLPRSVAALACCARDLRPVMQAGGLDLYNPTRWIGQGGDPGWHSGTLHRHPLVHVPPEARGAWAFQEHDALWDCVLLLLTLQALTSRSPPTASALRRILAEAPDDAERAWCPSTVAGQGGDGPRAATSRVVHSAPAAGASSRKQTRRRG
jgi:hypothetical protein